MGQSPHIARGDTSIYMYVCINKKSDILVDYLYYYHSYKVAKLIGDTGFQHLMGY